MEVAVLTARLEAQIAQFQTNMRLADASVNSLQRELVSLTGDAEAANKALDGVKVDPTKAGLSKSALKQIEAAVNAVRDASLEAQAEVEGIGFRQAQVAKFVADADIVKREINDITRDLRQMNRESVLATALPSIGGGRSFRGPGGRFVAAPSAPSGYDPRYGNPVTDWMIAEQAGMHNRSEVVRLAAQQNAARMFVREAEVRYGTSMAPTMGELMDARRMADEVSRRNASELIRLRLRSGGGLFGPGSVVGEPDIRSRFGLGGGAGASGILADRIGNESARATRVARDADIAAGGNGNGDALRRAARGSDRGPNVPPRGGRNFFTGILPGGRRAGAGLITSAIGLGIAAGPAVAAGGAGLAVASAAGLEGLLGGAATLKLAFADITSAAFTTQKGFDALTPVQKSFVQNLRSIDEGFTKPLERLAASKVLPGLTAGINAALTPASIKAIRGGVSAFGGAISGEAKDLGNLFGSTQFSAAFGAVLKSDARLLDDMLDVATRLFDAFIHLQQAAIPLTKWLGDSAVKMGQWVDKSVQAAQKSGQLAAFFDKAKVALQHLGGLVESVGSLLGAVLGGVGFKNSIAVVDLLTAAFNGVARFVRANQDLIRGFISGLVQAVRDLFGVIGPLADGFTKAMHAIRDFVKPVSDATNGLIGIRGLIDGLVILMGVRWVLALKLVRTALLGLADSAVLSAITELGVAISTSLIGPLGIAVGLGLLLAKIFDNNTASFKNWGDVVKASNKTGLEGELARKIMKDPNARQKLAPFFFMNGGGYQVPGTGGSAPRYATPGAGTFGGDVIGGGFSPPPPKPAPFGGDILGGAFHPGTGAGHGKPGPLQGTGSSGVLPVKLENAILLAQYAGNIPAERAAINAGIAWINAHKGAIKDQTTLSSYLQEGISLKSELAGLAGSSSARFRSPLSAGGAVFNAQQRLGQAMTSGSGVSFAKQVELAKAFGAAAKAAYDHLKNQVVAVKELGAKQAALTALARDEARARKDVTMIVERQARAMVKAASDAVAAAKANYQTAVASGATSHDQLLAANAYLQTLLKQEDVLKKQLRAGRDSVAAAKELGRIHNDITKAKKDIVGSKLDEKWAKMLGLGPGPQSVSAEHVVARERSTLLRLVRDMSRGVRGRRGVAGGSVDPYSAVPGAANMSVQQLVKALEKHGANFSKRAIEDFKVFQTIIDESKKSGHKIATALTDQIYAVLKQIEQNTHPKGGSYPNTFHIPSQKEIMKGLAGLGTAKGRLGFARRIAEEEMFGGKIPAGMSALGVPVGLGAHHHQGLPDGLGGTYLPGLPGRLGNAPASQVTIVINGYEKDPKVLAAMIRAELLKTGRRNPTQTRGPVSGRKLGLA